MANAQTHSSKAAEERMRDNNEDPAPWRPAEVSESASDTKTAGSSKDNRQNGDPGRTPGSAEGVEDFEKTGNE